MSNILFDDDYDGERFTYGLQNRPLSFASVPKGWIIDSNREHPDFLHGTVDYPGELTEDEVRSFQLVKLDKDE